MCFLIIQSNYIFKLLCVSSHPPNNQWQWSQLKLLKVISEGSWKLSPCSEGLLFLFGKLTGLFWNEHNSSACGRNYGTSCLLMTKMITTHPQMLIFTFKYVMWAWVGSEELKRVLQDKVEGSDARQLHIPSHFVIDSRTFYSIIYLSNHTSSGWQMSITFRELT